MVNEFTESPRGSLYVAAPLGVGRRLIAPQVPAFLAEYPEVSVRLRLTDRKVDLTTEGLDLAYFLGQPEDSNLQDQARSRMFSAYSVCGPGLCRGARASGVGR